MRVKRAEPETIIEIKNLTVRNGAQVLIDNVSLSFQAGRDHGPRLRAGIGKSTLLRASCGFFRPDGGQVLYRGRDVATLGYQEERDFQANTGFVFQNGGLLVNTKIYDNVAMPLRYRPELSEAEVDSRVRTALATVAWPTPRTGSPGSSRSRARSSARSRARSCATRAIIFYDNFFKGTEVAVWQSLIRS